MSELARLPGSKAPWFKGTTPGSAPLALTWWEPTFRAPACPMSIWPAPIWTALDRRRRGSAWSTCAGRACAGSRPRVPRGSTSTWRTLAWIRAVLLRALIHTCTLERVSLVAADLTGATIVRCNLGEADLRDADFQNATTLDSTFRGAARKEARRFASSREMIVELALGTERRWCYEEWMPLLRQRPDALRAVLDAFSACLRSGLLPALRAASRKTTATTP